MSPFYLFLDFDGVLHNAGECPRLFEHADRLGNALLAFPEVRVVISSSWREIHPLDELRDFCGPILGGRVIDATQVFRGRRASNDIKPRLRLRLGGHAPILQLAVEPQLLLTDFYERFEEITIWLALCAGIKRPLDSGAPQALERQDWAAIDDFAAWFPPRCEQLIRVDGGLGLDDAHLTELKARLVAHRRISTNVS